MAQATPDSELVRCLLQQVQQGHARSPRPPPRLDTVRTARLPAAALWDPRLSQRVDPSDLVQETQLEIVQRLEEFPPAAAMSFALWIRKQAYERLQRWRATTEAPAPLLVTREALAGGVLAAGSEAAAGPILFT